MGDRWRRRRHRARVEEGDGSPLRPFRWYHLLTRSMFSITLPSEGPAPGPETGSRYLVDVNYLADGEKRGDGSVSAGNIPAALYRDGVQVAMATRLPAAFSVAGGDIEVALTTFGMRRIHLVREDGTEQVLTPHPATAEGRRARVDRTHPGISRAIGVAAVLVLLVGLALAVPQLLELVTGFDIVAERVGTFTSPVSLPAWLNTTLLVAGVLAAIERALMLRNHWLIDADTTWFDD
ncbi:MAG: hypothetical protein Q4G40_09060 [Brachybacterium sp.]|nr:hypothetical protein [Brachybacterium sp.]